MPATAKTPRTSWIEAGLAALAEGGPDAVRVDVLAKSLGATRGSFYWHFTDRAELLEALLDTWEAVGTQSVIDEAEATGGDAVSKIRRLGAEIPATPEIAVDLAVRDWARRDPSVMKRLRRVDDRRADYLRSLFRSISDDPYDIEARTLIALALAIANQSLAHERGGLETSEVLAAAIETLVA